MNCPCASCNEHNPLPCKPCGRCATYHLTDEYKCASESRGDPFKTVHRKICKHCNGDGIHIVTEQLPPPELKVCGCCGGGGLLYWHPWDDDEDQKSHVEHCNQCNGLRYQKNEISQHWRDLHKKCTENGGLHFDLEGCRGVKMTVEEGRAYGLEPVEIPKL